MAIRSVDELLAAISEGKTPKYACFWGHTSAIAGQIDQSCLSNWFPATFSLHEIEYPTTEHYMMAEKARLFGDQQILQEIQRTNSPGKAKALGRKVAGFKEETWRQHRFEIVVRGNLAKFSQHPSLQEFLLQTGNKVLVEASPHDSIWGIGLSVSSRQATNPSEWKGLNLLGFALMEVRDRLQTTQLTESIVGP